MPVTQPVRNKHASRGWGAVLAAGAFLAAAPASAAGGGWATAAVGPGTEVEARLVAAIEATGDLGAVPAGLHIVLPDGWKTYWRSPGDAGLPPRLDWTGSTNLAAADIEWPAPHRFTLFGLETFGYAGEVVLPLTLRPEQPGAAMALRAQAELLVCSQICVPATVNLALDLPAGPATADGDAANLIGRYAAMVPDDGAASGLAIEGAGADGPAQLRVAATARAPFRSPDVIVEAPDGWVFDPPQVALGDGGRRLDATLQVAYRPDEADRLAGLPVTLTLIDGDRSMELATEVAAAPPAMPRTAPALLGMLGIALLGGLILNVMPCVLPVLSIKLFSAVKHGASSPGRVRLGFLVTAGGIVASFLALAGAAIAVKAAGGMVGWGIQFQQPLFIVTMIVVLTLFAGNLLDLFQIRLPAAMADRAAQAGGRRGLTADFATGAFATLLATPCSAPFLGTAVGFALARGPAEILAIFAALGIGLALPYLAVAAVPHLARHLPRPGRWMVVLKRILSLALAATALWLLTVLDAQSGPLAAYAVGGLMAAIILALWARHRLGAGARPAATALVGLLAAAAFVPPLQATAPADAGMAADEAWSDFDRAGVDALVADGRTVFVDVTAEWCITCKANKALVLDRGAVAERLHGDAVVAMRADWTRPDAAISAYLAGHGRYGVPFNAVYGPGAPDGIVLPEILTPETVLEALARAGGAG